MKSREARLKVLLDTSFTLPTLGIDMGEAVLKGLRRLAGIKAEIYYSRFSILESLWVAVKLPTTLNRQSFSLGLRSIIEGGRYRKVEEDFQTFNNALNLYMLGHRDMIDNILYASSVSQNLKLLTVDRELKKFISEKRLENTLIFPNQLP